MNQEDCQEISCCDPPLFDYSLVNYPVYYNEEITVFVPCPAGMTCALPGISITIPAGSIAYRPTTRAGNTPGAVNQAIQDQANQNANNQAIPILNPQPPVSGGGIVVYASAAQSYTAQCPSGKYGVPVTRSAPAGYITSLISQAEADQLALDSITTDAEATLVCYDYTNTEQTATCPDGYTGTPVTKAAGTYFSDVSQADANALALAAATAGLVCTETCQHVALTALTWTHTDNGTGSGTEGSGSLTLPCNTPGPSTLTSNTVTNNCADPITVQVDYSGDLIVREVAFTHHTSSASIQPTINGVLQSATTQTATSTACGVALCPQETVPFSISRTFVVPAGQTFKIALNLVSNQDNSPPTIDNTGAFTVTIT